GALGNVLSKTALKTIEVRRDEQVIRPVSVYIASSKRDRCLDLRRRSGNTGLARDVSEFRNVDGRLSSHPARRDEIPWRKREDRAARDRTFGPFHFLQRRLIRCRDFHETEKASERLSRFGSFFRTQKLHRAVEIRPRFLRHLWRYLPQFLEVLHDAVHLAATRERIYELEPRDEICRRDREYIPQSVFVPARRSAVTLLT